MTPSEKVPKIYGRYKNMDDALIKIRESSPIQNRIIFEIDEVAKKYHIFRLNDDGIIVKVDHGFCENLDCPYRIIKNF